MIYFYRVILKFFSQLNVRLRVFLSYIKVQFKERNPLINSIDKYIHALALLHAL